MNERNEQPYAASGTEAKQHKHALINKLSGFDD